MTLSYRRRQKSGIPISLGLVLLLLVTAQPAAFQGGIPVREDSVLLNFPDKIEFHLSAIREAVIEKIPLTYRTNARSC